ncbi:MAG: Beta-barrel assembly-enhancing protease [Chlamydiae bacterium]|nr:Beta-barrel assembly-enhancing protease [Chlamydiota bacterium]
MFATIVLLTLGLTIYLAYRERIKYPHLSKQEIQNSLRSIARHVALEKWEEAEKELAPLLDKGLCGKETLLLHSQVLRGTKKLEQGLFLVMDASRLYPEELLFRQEEGIILLEMGHPIDALSAFKVCAPILRSEADLLFVAQAYFQGGYYEHCLEILFPLIPHTRNGKVLILAGELYYEQKNYSEAIRFYQKALEFADNLSRVLNRLGHAYLRSKQLDRAEKIFRMILEKDSSDVTATLGLGGCMQKQGQYQKALHIYQSGKAWEKNHPQILQQTGICATLSKKYYFASRYFAQAIEIQGPTPQLLAWYGYSLECEKKWSDAEQNYFQFIELFPGEPNGYRSLAWLYGVGLSTSLSLEQAFNYAQVSLKLVPDPVSWEIMGACEARKGNYARAHQILEFLLLSDSDRRSRTRRQQAMRKLRKNLPLGDPLVLRSLAA